MGIVQLLKHRAIRNGDLSLPFPYSSILPFVPSNHFPAICKVVRTDCKNSSSIISIVTFIRLHGIICLISFIPRLQQLNPLHWS
jgi:L-cystine uptake protein TcyP (sodium:dicarboxylate symporter family)